MQNPFTWHHPTPVHFGVGKLNELPDQVEQLAGPTATVFLVTGRHSLRARGILQKVLDDLEGHNVVVYDHVTPFPSPDEVDKATAACRADGAEIVVAIGGGSVLDLAKAVAILSVHDGAALEYATASRKFHRRGLPFVAVPTTSGSSSEVTSGAALWDMDGKKHYGLGGPLMYPDIAIVDPDLAMSMPSSLAAVTGMDAFTSAFETYWSTEAQPISDALDLEVIRAFTTHLERSVIQGDLESRSECAMAATMSGIAYSNSRPNACHAVGGPLTLYWGVEHGQAVGITLAAFLSRCGPAIAHKLPALFHALGVEDMDRAVERIARIMRRCGLETTLGGLGLTEGDLDALVEHTGQRRLASLPITMGPDQLRAMLSTLL